MKHSTEIHTLFPMFSKELERDFLREARQMDFAQGEQVYEHGFPCPFVPFVCAGMVRVFNSGESGREITLYRVRPGGLCVLSSTCSLFEREFPAIAEAEVPSSLYILPGKAFRGLFQHYTPLRELVFDQLSRRLADLMMVIEEVTLWRVDLRLANYLLEKTRLLGEEELYITHAKLAVELGSAREVVSRILKDFERKGFIVLRRGRIELREPTTFEKYRDTLRASS